LVELQTRPALSRDPEKLALCEVWDQHLPKAVRYTDLDINGHMTASRYIGSLLDAYPIDFHRAHRVSALEINYLEEVMAGDVLDVRTRRKWSGFGRAGGRIRIKQMLHFDRWTLTQLSR